MRAIEYEIRETAFNVDQRCGGSSLVGQQNAWSATLAFYSRRSKRAIAFGGTRGARSKVRIELGES